MKAGKALGPLGIVVEMIRTAGERASPWSVTSQLQSFMMARYPLTASRVSLSASMGRIGKGQLPRSQADKAGHESPGEDCGRPHQTVGDNRRFPVWLHPGRGTKDAIFVVRQLQEKYLAANKTLHGFCRPGEGVWSSTSEGHLVGAEKNLVWRCGLCDWCRGCMQMRRFCPCWWWVQWRVRSEGWCSPRLSTQPAALHHCARSLIMRVPLGGPLGGPLCWLPCYHCWIASGICQEALGLERSKGEERTESKCRKDKDHDLWYGPGPPAEFRQVSVALEWAATASSAMAASTRCTRNAVGSSSWQRTLTTDVHSARELQAPWMADHRRMSRSDLTSWRQKLPFAT